MKYGVLVKTNSDSIGGELHGWCTDPQGKRAIFESREQAQAAAKALNQQAGLTCCCRYFASPLNGTLPS